MESIGPACAVNPFVILFGRYGFTILRLHVLEGDKP